MRSTPLRVRVSSSAALFVTGFGGIPLLVGSRVLPASREERDARDGDGGDREDQEKESHERTVLPCAGARSEAASFRRFYAASR